MVGGLETSLTKKGCGKFILKKERLREDTTTLSHFLKGGHLLEGRELFRTCNAGFELRMWRYWQDVRRTISQ